MICRLATRACCSALALVAALTLGAPRAHATACSELPVLLVVQDRSGSMADVPDPSSSDSKWDIAASVVPQVLNQYNNQFQFGLMYLPGSSDACDPGYIDQPVPSTANDIANSYSNTGPQGATPTAQSLAVATQYLNSLNLNVPAYILLITDGMPNCNGSLNGSSCTCTVSGGACDPNQGGTNLDCLDDTDTEDASAAAYAAGYPVYVVGFGDASTAGNNKTVLDGIASNGGTGHAYSANNQSQLDTQLNTIVGSVGSCCMNICVQGQTNCDPNGNVTQCVLLPSGCLGWGTPSSCGSGTTCSNGSCQSCTGTCAPGSTQCGFFGDLETCVADANGCTDWTSDFCPSGSTCSGDSCQSCASTCTAGETQCQGDTLYTCTTDYEGCTSWQASSCGYGSVCSVSGGNAACVACNTACSAGSQTCADAQTSELCVADNLGCTTWQTASCGAGQTCSGGSCNECNACNVGDWRCAGNGPQTCVDLGNGCTGWQDAQPCAAGQICQAGACVDCSGQCNVGDVQCDGNGVQTCEPQAGACNAWVTTQTCGNNELCSGGACCQNTCEDGDVECGPNGEVLTCVGSAGSCPTWQASSCGAGSTCIAGACAMPCTTTNELSSCPAGYQCQTSAQGSFCVVPGGSGNSNGNGSGSGNGSSGAGGTTSSGGTTGSGSSGTTTSTSGGAAGSTGSTASTGHGSATAGVGSGGNHVTAGGSCSSAGGDAMASIFALGLVLARRRRR
ncbi:MAG: VWA domain-containing protein [Deltaproteobacteria bacterium]|nr:VWA domain-containing protein [Deltaproteobacteria bacterium]